MYSLDEFEETEPELELLEWAGMVSNIHRFTFPHSLTVYFYHTRYIEQSKYEPRHEISNNVAF